MWDLLRKLLPGTVTEQAQSLECYIRSYRETVTLPGGLVVEDLEPHHCCFSSSLHRHAHAPDPDISAFLYAALRLPDCVNRLTRVLIGPTEEAFAAAGFPDVEAWKPVESRSRRRRQHYDGAKTLAVFVTSITDLDDVIPSLCAFQIEWNKLHSLLARSPLATELSKCEVRASHVGMEIRRALGLARNDWELLNQVWSAGWDQKLADLATAPVALTIERLPLFVGYFEGAAGAWWERVTRALALDASMDRPVYLVSSNTHSLANLVSGYASAHTGELLTFLREQNPEGLWQTWLDARKDPDRNPLDLLYYGLRHYVERVPRAAAEKMAWERSAGFMRHAPAQYPHLEAQRIDVNRLTPDRLDRRLRRPRDLGQSQAVILNVDYPLGLAAAHLLSQACGRFPRLRGVFILGKSAATIGRLGDIMIPSQVYDSHTKTRYRFHNSLSVRHLVPFLNRTAAFDDQRSITVRGTFLHGRHTLNHLLQDDFTGIEMEAGPYLETLYRHFKGCAPPAHETLELDPPPGFSLGLLHYTSDTPYNVRPSLLSTRLGLTGLEAAYASSLAILQRIMDLESKGGRTP